MSAHAECGAVGKFDCAVDEWLHGVLLDSGEPGEGDVQSPSAWFAEVDLSRDTEADAIEHYDSEWIIARELNDGRWFVEVYPTLADRDDRMDALRHGLDAWDSDEFDTIVVHENL